jgi:hypothetical protein
MLFESVRGYRASGNFDILAEDLGTAEHSEAAIADKEVTRIRHLVFDLIIESNSTISKEIFFLVEDHSWELSAAYVGRRTRFIGKRKIYTIVDLDVASVFANAQSH